MTSKEPIIDYVPIYEGQQTIHSLLTDLIVERILKQNAKEDLPKEQEIVYNADSVPRQDVPGLCGEAS